MTDPASATEQYFDEHRPAGVVSAYLFGSHARGTAHGESDVDVGVMLDPTRISKRRNRSRASVRLSSELVGALHRNDVQVVSLLDVSPELAAAAVIEGRRVYCVDDERDRALVLQVLLRHGDLRPFLRRHRERKLDALRR